MYNNPNKFQAVYDLFSDPEVKKYFLERLAKEISVGVRFGVEHGPCSDPKPKLIVSLRLDGIEVATDSEVYYYWGLYMRIVLVSNKGAVIRELCSGIIPYEAQAMVIGLNGNINALHHYEVRDEFNSETYKEYA
jgi:hypothetical protein